MMIFARIEMHILQPLQKGLPLVHVAGQRPNVKVQELCAAVIDLGLGLEPQPVRA